MKSGIIGRPGSGKTTVFEALTANLGGGGRKGEHRIGTVKVPDERVDALSRMYAPQKTTYAHVEYFLPGRGQEKEGGKERSIWTAVRDCDTLMLVLRNFRGYGLDPPHPVEDFIRVDQELILADFIVAEKRLERLELDRKRGKKIDPEEIGLLQSCLEHLENEAPLRRFPEIASAPRLKGYAFLSAKPMLLLINNEDDDESLPESGAPFNEEHCVVIRGKLEQELAQMSPEEVEEFLKEFNIGRAATDRVITGSYELLGLISFFTVGDDEVKAWTIRSGTTAVDAADVIHSDMKKGFIRAEVLSYDDLTAAGSYAEARKQGLVRLEGKTYEVRDGDIFHVRFNI